MTTLSKEDVVRMAVQAGFNPEASGLCCTQFKAFADIARADLVAENERLKNYFSEDRDKLLGTADTIDQLADQLINQLTATRTNLAAARELLKEIKDVLVIANQDLASSGCSLDSEILEIENFLESPE